MKKVIILLLVILVGLLSAIAVTNISTDKEVDEPVVIQRQDEEHNVKEELTSNYIDYIMSGGPPKDGIPPIDDPEYISLEEADKYLNDFDKVFVYVSAEGVYIYPQRILVWHEIVNDNIADENVSITYCPLTGSAICYLGPTTYGTSGKLLNSNLVMYDRATDSYIPQILGVGINNNLKGTALNTNTLLWANWIDVKTEYDDLLVLSTETGYLRDYNSDPYGSYLPDDDKSYYYVGEPFFPLMEENDGTFTSKKVVVGVKYDKGIIAIDPKLVRENGVLSFSISSESAVAIYDYNLKATRVFLSSVEDNEIVLKMKENQIIDQRGIIWNEQGISSNNEHLTEITFFDVMWFAWHAFYPDTEVIK